MNGSIVILDGGRRTPRADILVNNQSPGLFSRFTATQLGGMAIKAALQHTPVDKELVGHVVMGMAQHSHRDSIYAAQGMKWRGGLGDDVPATFAGFLGWLSREGPFPEGTDAGAVLSRADPAPKIRAARRPLLVITGGNDPVYPGAAAAALERAARSNPYARFVETPGGGHIGQLGLYPDWMATLMTRFFRAATGIPSRPEGSDRP